MFGKKSALDPKKILQKFLDTKKDSTARLKYLKSILDIVDVVEAKTIFETNFSHVYYVFYDQFISVEGNLQLRAHKNNREEFDVVLSVFEKILTLLPELLSRKWQCRSIGRLMKKLLHPGNALKLRREAMRLFLLWYQILGENSPQELHWMFACLVPGFHVIRDHGSANLESIICETAVPSVAAMTNTAMEHIVNPVEINPILPPQSGDRQCEDPTQFFLENLMDCIVTQPLKIEWRDKSLPRQQKCFQFLFDRFKKFYLPTIFPNFDWRTNIFMPCLELPEMRSHINESDCHNSNDNSVSLGFSSLLHCKVVVVRWFASFTSPIPVTELPDYQNMAQKGARIKQVKERKKPEEADVANENKSIPVSGETNTEKHQSAAFINSNTERESSISYNSNDDHTMTEHVIVKETLYYNHDNINFMHEIFRQAMLLPLSEAPTIRRVISVYRDWITNRDDYPPFMYEPRADNVTHVDAYKFQPNTPATVEPTSSFESSRTWRPRNDSYLGAIHRENINIKAGLQKTLQLFITHAANVFLYEIGPEDDLFLDQQVDMCKRVLNIYRYIVMNVKMEQRTWEQLLIVLLHVTSQILGDLLPAKKENTLGGRLAPALFQTLIVTWIKANLNVVISVELWDQFLQVLSSLTHWEELIREWGKTMETLTRVLARLVYGLDLTDLPLDRLSEQKLKKRRGKQPVSNATTTSFSKGWSRHGLNGVQLPRRSEAGTPDSIKTFDKSVSSSSAPDKKIDWHLAKNRSRSNSGDVNRKRRHRPFSESERGSSITRSISEGNLSSRSRSVSFRLSKHDGPAGSTDLTAAAEQEVASILAPFEDYLKESSSSTKVGIIRKSKSLDSLKNIRACSPSSMSDLSVDGPSRSPSPSPSTGLESNSIKDSPMQIDGVGGENPCTSEPWNGSKEELRSIMSGGTREGWLPDVAVVLWKRMLGALGDVNKINDPEMHAQVFQYLVDLFETLVKMRENQGVTVDNQSTPAPPELTPPLNILAPWLFKAVSLPTKYKKGKLWALRLLCSMTVRRHDLALRRDHVVQFYSVLHSALCGSDQEVINTIVKYCGPQFFSLKLDGSSLLVMDFIHAANTIASSSDLRNVPRTEAMRVLGALVCFPNIFVEIPVLQRNVLELVFIDHKSVKDQIVNVLLKSGRHEPAGLARCIALSSLGIYLYEELTHYSYHGKMRDAIDVLLAALRITNKVVGQVACDMLYLLTNHIVALMKNFPDVPKKIVEVLAATLNNLLIHNNTSGDFTKDHEQLVISMMFCLGEWCMNVPSHLLLQQCTYGEPLLSVVFRVLTKAVFGNSTPDHRITPKLDDINLDFDVDIKLNDLQDDSSLMPGSPKNYGLSGPEFSSAASFGSSFSSPIFCEGRELNMIKLTAKMIITHLSNHLGHFPMGIGAARLTSMVNETDDIPGLSADELSSNVFHAPNVQFFVLNNKTLISFVELPTLDVPGGGVTAGLTTAKSQVRVILRDMSGKFSWDSSVLYSPPGLLDYTKLPQDCSSENGNLQFPEEEFPNVVNQINSNAHLLSMGHQHSHGLPTFEDASENVDSLNELLHHIGVTSPECLYRSGQPLNIPQELPAKLCSETQEDIMTTVLNQRNYEMDYHIRHKNDACMMGRPAQPSVNSDPSSPFHHCRLLINQLGLMQWEKRTRFDLLKKNEKLIRELRNLDNQKCRETHKIAVIYVADGQEDKNSVLMNMGGGQAYEEFVAGLAWEVELQTHTGFMGGLQSNGSTGDTAPYYATSFLEVIFHVATRMPSHSEESKIQKLRHLGNDEVHIVWSEHQRDYRQGIITTEFGDVLIVIYPLPNKLYRIQITRKAVVPFFGPLYDGAIVDHKVLPGLVRATAINASRATRSTIPIFQHFYKERAKALETIIKNHKDLTMFEEFTSNVVMPAQCKSFHYGQPCSAGSGFKCDSSNVLGLSNLTAALLDSHTHHSYAPVRSRPSSLSSCSEQSTPATVHDAHYRAESFDYVEREDLKDGKAISPKTSKRLSFKSNMRKSHPPKMASTPPESPPRGKK